MQCHMVYGNDAERIGSNVDDFINWMTWQRENESRSSNIKVIDRPADLIRQFAHNELA